MTSSRVPIAPGKLVHVEHILGWEKLGMGPHNNGPPRWMDGRLVGQMDGWTTDSSCERICPSCVWDTQRAAHFVLRPRPVHALPCTSPALELPEVAADVKN